MRGGRSRPLGLPAVALLCAACAAGPVAGHVTPRPEAGLAPRVASELDAAQEAMFGDAYTTADTWYARALADDPASAAAHAGLALFLNYRGDSTGALAEARRAVALDARSGDAQAVLCRVQDWAGDLSDAVAAGRRAVAAAPGAPLAHLFLAEALADTGERTASQTQITVADGEIALRPTAYLRAEALREAANLDADAGAQAAQVAALQQARDLQPAWLYRSTELVNAELAAGDDAAARRDLEAAAATPTDDVEVLEALGNDALFVADGGVAQRLWSLAMTLSPTDAAILAVNGELAVAVNRDVNTAVSDFQAALAADPEDAASAAYLVALERYVQHQPGIARAEIAAAVEADVSPHPLRPPPLPSPGASSASARALAAINAARAAAGLAAVGIDDRLGASAEAHSFYWLFNNMSPSVVGLGVHEETPGLPGYSGVYPWTRATAYGYPSQRIAEDITHRGDPVGAVSDWLNSVYHRFPIMRPDLVAIGFGEATLGSLDIEDMEFGYATPAAAPPVRYPAPGATNVPAIFGDNELPDPVPKGAPRTTGYPVTVTFAIADRVRLSSFVLVGPDGQAVAAYQLVPSAATENSASLLPVAPLARGATYTAHVVASDAGHGYDETWSFTTAP